jgi:outer membrane protein, multidrug efflux system
MKAKHRWHWLAIMLTAGLAACSLGPEYKHPNIAAPANWRTNEEQARVAWPSTTWWQGFSSPQLNEFITQAQRANDDIAAAIARVQEADAQVRIASAALFPSVEADATATRARQQSISTTGSEATTYTDFSPQLAASYELDFWGKNRATREAAKALAAASRYDRATVELTVMTSVANAYFQALGLRDRLSVAQDNLTNAQTTLNGLKLEQDAGTATALDVAQQETTVAVLNAAIPPLKQQLRQTIDALAILIGQEPEAVDITSGKLADLTEPEVRPGLPSELLARRPDIAEAEAQLISANANIKVARAAFFPSISLTASGGYESDALAGLLTPANRIFALTAGLIQPIFEGGALEGQYDYSKARYAELLADYHKSVISAFGNVEDALIALKQTADQQQRQQVAVDTARRAYELSKSQMQAGTINVLIVLSTETALVTAEDSLVQVEFAHLHAVLNLFSALGGSWQQTS